MKLKYVYTGLLSLAFIAVGFFGGYYMGSVVSGQKNETEAVKDNNTEIQSFHSEPTEITPGAYTAEKVMQTYYMLVSENSSLSLYEINGNSRVLIKSIKYNPEFVPNEDRRKLESGIRLDSKEEGFGLIEDFTS